MKRLILVVLMAAIVLIAASIAYADTSNVSVTAQSNSLLTISVTTSTVDFGPRDPGSPVTIPGATTVNVASNKLFTLSKAITDNTTTNGNTGLTTTGATLGALSPNSYSYPENYTIEIPWTVAPGQALGASVVYTALQN